MSCKYGGQVGKKDPLATGTGNLAIRIAKAKPQLIVGLDISEQMLSIGKAKVKKQKLDKIIEFKQASCYELPFEEGAFDTVTVSFGVRNVENPLAAIKEAFRVLENDGLFMGLEFGIPDNRLIRVPFLFYFTRLLPFLGGLVSGKKYAYSYLTTSVKSFPYGDDFLKILDEAGFTELRSLKCTFGVTYLYIARKRIPVNKQNI